MCLYFHSDSHTLLYSNHVLQRGILLSCANMSLPQAIRYCMLIAFCSKVIFYHVLIFASCFVVNSWGDLFYVLPCVILFLCFSVLLALRLPRMGKRELILVLFVRLFVLCLFGFVGFLFRLVSGNGCGLWLWHSQDFCLTFFAAGNISTIREVLRPTPGPPP